jgi:hypothetical protein
MVPSGTDNGKSMATHIKLFKDELEAVMRGKVQLGMLGVTEGGEDIAVQLFYCSDLKNLSAAAKAGGGVRPCAFCDIHVTERGQLWLIMKTGAEDTLL